MYKPSIWRDSRWAFCDFNKFILEIMKFVRKIDLYFPFSSDYGNETRKLNIRDKNKIPFITRDLIFNFSKNVEQTLPVLWMTNPNVNSCECSTKYHDFPNPDRCKNRPIIPGDGSIQSQRQQDRKD